MEKTAAIERLPTLGGHAGLTGEIQVVNYSLKVA
jgi:hypothetical protein